MYKNKPSYRLVFDKSPFLPKFDQGLILGRAIENIGQGFSPSFAVCLAVEPLMDIRADWLHSNIRNLKSYGTVHKDIDSLVYGYKLPIHAIVTASYCKTFPVEKRPEIFEEIVQTSHKFETLIIQDFLLKNLNATINLLGIDQTTTQIFDFFKNYPFSQEEYFLNGMEIAAIVYFGILSQIPSNIIGNDWLNSPTDPTIT